MSASDVKDCQMAVFKYNIDIMMQKYSNDFDAIVLLIRYSQIFFVAGITHTSYRLLNYFYRPSVDNYNNYSSEESTPERPIRRNAGYSLFPTILPSMTSLRSSSEECTPERIERSISNIEEYSPPRTRSMSNIEEYSPPRTRSNRRRSD